MKIRLFSILLLTLLVSGSLLSAIEITGQDIIPVSVSVTGDVTRPGIYTLTNMNRMSEAINLADIAINQSGDLLQANQTLRGITIPQYKITTKRDSLEIKEYNHRNVVINRQGQTFVYDLQKFLILGDLTQNPYLKDGDVIIVNSPHSTVSIEGAIHKPGSYELRTGDTLNDILDLALGVNEDADLKHVMLYRYKESFIDFEKSVLDISGYPESMSSALSTSLKPGDRILIPVNAEYRKAYKVEIIGQVKMPGIYYINDKTSVYDLLNMCGGPTQEADLYSSFTYNRLVSESFDPDFERLNKLYMAQMTWLEYSYLRTKTRQLKGKYSLDVLKCWESKGIDTNLILKNGDVLIVPEKISGVWVAGQVRHPGLVTWKEGMIWKDYLASAGGYANNRKLQGIRVIRYSSGNWVKPTKELKLYPGDTIFVPDKQDTYIWDDIKDAILIASQVLTIIIAFKTINSY